MREGASIDSSTVVSESASKKMIGVSLDKEVVAWLDGVIRIVRAQRKDINRSKVLNCILRKITEKRKPDDIASLVLETYPQIMETSRKRYHQRL